MTDSERIEVANVIDRLALTDSEKAELVRIVERLARPEVIKAMAKLKKEIGVFGIAMGEIWTKTAILQRMVNDDG